MALTAQTSFDTILNSAAIAAAKNSSTQILTAFAGCENLWINFINGKSVQVTNVMSYALDPPAYAKYNASYTYLIGNVVQYTDNNLYKSLVNSNTGNTPASSPTDWTQLPLQWIFDGETYRDENDQLTIVNGIQAETSGFTVVTTGAAGTESSPYVILNDEQQHLPLRPSNKLRTRVIFTRQGSDGTAMATREVFQDLIASISDSPWQ